MRLHQVFLGLGGNIGDTQALLKEALSIIKELPSTHDLQVSSFYQTSPVSDLPQDDYINAVCSFKTTHDAQSLFTLLKSIEQQLGKVPKNKNEPRAIDLDLLFFDCEIHKTPELNIPHPRWKERLFVIKPLSDLVSEVFIPNPLTGEVCRFDIIQYLENFPNFHNETVIKIKEEPCKMSESKSPSLEKVTL